ncbi:hypothetical protein FN846DRAFT_937042 [Sphaerosporella brunnea]|uniref:Histone acetyltransferase n=1 Tax=Sphaerosporella brunnea TaxID=1250544 RepID=A0A5J5F479_9PEZI|nr:hypothetical protein FN846DRAFT_937042 [Sphaerosporella brunnea]
MEQQKPEEAAEKEAAKRARASSTPAPKLVSHAQKTVQKTPQKSPRKSPQKTAQKAPPKTPAKTPGRSQRAGKAPRNRKVVEEEAENSAVTDDEDDEGEDEDTDDFVEDDDSSASEKSSESEEEWGGDGDEEDENENSHLCIHCQLDEDHDPASDFEDALECSVCAAFSHRNCDRTANESGGVKSAFDEESATWRCPSCAASGLEPGFKQTLESRTPARVRRSSPIKEDKASRSLRKRKAGEMDEDQPRTRRRKPREKPQPANGDSVGAANEGDNDEGEPNDTTLTNGARKRRKLGGPNVAITRGPQQLIIHIGGLDSEKLSSILSTAPKPSQRRVGRSQTPARKQRVVATSAATAVSAPLTASTTLYPIIYEDDRLKPYGGILSEAESNTKETLPGTSERTRFEAAKERAEQEQKMRTRIMNSMSRTYTQGRKERDEEAKRVGEASLIECIHFGEYEIDTWYAAPYPEEYSLNRVLWICEFCLKYMNSEYVCWRHKLKCPAKHPPGDEIYRDGTISVFEIDGRKQPVYCQNLCLMAKLFLGSKTLYYDVHPFLFYVMTERDDKGMHLVGYFSKEKREGSQNNVSCIITLPIHQRKGYGNLLIDFSYLLTRVEGRTGSPEKPFSDLGLVSYRNYWKLKLCYELRHQKDSITIGQLSQRTGMTTDDIICGLESLNALVRDPVTAYYALRLDHALFESLIESWEAKGYIKLNPKALIWTPYLMGRSQAEHLNDMPMSTIAPRLGEHPQGTKNGDKKVEDAPDGAEEQADPNAMVIDSVPAADGAPATNGPLSDSINPALITAKPESPPAPSSDSNKHQQPLISSDILEQLREIPPTRFEIVPPPPGARGRQGGLKGTNRGRGRPRLGSPAPRGKGKGNYGATPGSDRKFRGRLRVEEMPRAISATPAEEKGRSAPRRIVTKAPRMRSLTAEASRPRSVSTERSVSGKGKGKSLANLVAVVATRAISASSSTASSSSSVSLD